MPNTAPVGGTTGGTTHATWAESLVADHLERYPLLEPVDAYKLLFQATMGPGHLIVDVESARERLIAEAEATLRDGERGAITPRVEPLRLDGALARVHLRPYVRAGLSLDDLAAAFLATAEAWRPRHDELAEALASVALAVGEGRLALPADETAALFASMTARALPAVHHSEAYRAAYRPAYRIADPRRLPPARR